MTYIYGNDGSLGSERAGLDGLGHDDCTRAVQCALQVDIEASVGESLVGLCGGHTDDIGYGGIFLADGFARIENDDTVILGHRAACGRNLIDNAGSRSYDFIGKPCFAETHDCLVERETAIIGKLDFQFGKLFVGVFGLNAEIGKNICEDLGYVGRRVGTAVTGAESRFVYDDDTNDFGIVCGRVSNRGGDSFIACGTLSVVPVFAATE